MRRVVVFGTTGSGKSWLAERLAVRHHLRLIELDALFWGKDWQPAPLELFRYRVEGEIRDGDWIVVGNYGQVRDLTWRAADTLVWLDLPFPLVIWRLFRRTLRRSLTKENLWGTGNTEVAGAFPFQSSVDPAVRDQDPSQKPRPLRRRVRVLGQGQDGRAPDQRARG